MLGLIPEEDMHVVLEDFNACIGSRKGSAEQWDRVRGRMATV